MTQSSFVNPFPLAPATLVVMSLVVMSLALAAPLSANAADLPRPEPVYKAAPAPVPALNWTGFYGGLHAGYAWSDVTVTDLNGGVDPGPFGYSPNGGIGGGQVGYNWQSPGGLWVLGVEADVGYIGLDGKGIIGSANAASHQNLTIDGGLYVDVTGRVGVTFGPAMLYAKGGWAWFDADAQQATTNPGYLSQGTGSFSGWTVGGGLEYMMAHNVSLKVEYQHFDFGSKTGSQTNVGDLSSPIGFQFFNSTDLTVDTVKAGLNYHW
jgi:outer membrane immunogenic protein